MQHTLTLNSGYTIPALGLGTWKAEPGLVKTAVEYAVLEAGYRHIDCASIYGNQAEIGEAFATIFSNKAIKREDLFITSKLWNTDHDPADVEAACQKTLKDLKLDYLDLYLMHWGVAFQHGEGNEPMGKNGRMQLMPVTIQSTWKAMEALVKKGLVKSIGVSNFTGPMIIDLMTYAEIKPAMNQIELHPYNAQSALIDFCHDLGIAITGYSPLGSPGNQKAGKPSLLQDSVVTTIAEAHQKTAGQVLINWAVARGTVSIPKSATPARILENSGALTFELTADEMKQLNQLDRRYRFVNPTGWGLPYFD